jgi:hypothetical protein
LRPKNINAPLNCWCGGFGFRVVLAGFVFFLGAALAHDGVPLLGGELAGGRLRLLEGGKLFAEPGRVVGVSVERGSGRAFVTIDPA